MLQKENGKAKILPNGSYIAVFQAALTGITHGAYMAPRLKEAGKYASV